ncbi:type I restriction enzyme S subunit [Sedimentibacter acidaminivorans]|uniref:Type I restriction enzyme S subunit n=1 Tax=Sedimentibacter acidaminivorans TaxID=913099 RepID=A0ABS4GGB7_9FIRM|nr:restriction endonuclease subunit S [Sedimentibacter acidaminivorans]MBP1926577.1 type I restriction enzyme S subunit [Sedimentibacter acidaminivorans]
MAVEMKFEDIHIEAKDQPYQIPSNWKWTKLGVIGNYINGKAFKSSDWREKGKPIIRIQNLTGTNNTYNYFDGEIDEKYYVQSGDFLISWSATLGAFIWQGENALLNQHIFKVDSYINKKFHYYLVQEVIEELYRNTHGSGMVHVTKTIFNNILVPLPPLPEQQRIVNRIESLFEKIDKAETLINEAREGFEKRKEAILAKAFRGELTEKWREEHGTYSNASNELEALKSQRLERYNSLIAIAKKEGLKKPKKDYDFSYERNDVLPEGWVESKLDNLVYFAGRIGWKGLKADEYVEDGPMLLSVYNLNYGDYVDYSEVNRITDERYIESPEIMVQNDDILLTKDGAGIGKLGFVKGLEEKATVNSSLLLIRADNSMIPKYLYYFLKGPDMQQVVRERITGSTTPHLFQRDIKNFIITIPPVEEQKAIINILDSLTEEQEKIDGITLLSDHIELLKKSILSKAFRGELGTNDPEELSIVL